MKTINKTLDKYARFLLNVDVDNYETLSDTLPLMKNQKYWTKINGLTFHFIDHNKNSDYQYRHINV